MRHLYLVAGSEVRDGFTFLPLVVAQERQKAKREDRALM